MNTTIKALRGIGVAVAIIALAAPVIHAQCPTSREFGGQGNGMLTGRVIIDVTTGGFPNDGNELTSIWDVANGSAGFGSGDHIPTNPGSCPNNGGSAGWYLTGTMLLGSDAGIQGFIGTAGCFPVQCPMPGEFISTLVEDENGFDAGFILYTVENTPAEIRPYDHARTAGINGIPSAVTTQVFHSYPALAVTDIAGTPPNTTLTLDIPDLARNYHGAGLTAAATTGIQSYDIVAHHGPAPPGRVRSFWNQGTVLTIPYSDSAVSGAVVEVICPTTADDTYLAVGATFVDPSTGGLASMYVGHVQIAECDPNIADPDAPSLQRAPMSDRPSLGHAGR